MSQQSSLPASFWNLELNNKSVTVDDGVLFIVETVQFTMVCITISIYSVIVWALIEAHRSNVEDLTSPFFKLCLSTAGVDFWTLLTNYFGAMFPKWGWFIPVYLFMGNAYGRVYLYFAWSTGICQAMGVSVLASNRLSVMLFPTSFQKIWRGYRLWVAIAIQYCTGLAIGTATFLNGVHLLRNEKNGVVPKFINQSMTTAFFIIGGGFLFVNSLYLVVTYCYLLWVLHKRNQKKVGSISTLVKSRAKEQSRMREVRLFTMSTIIVGVQLCVLLLFVFKGTNLLAFTNDQFYVVYNAVSDLYSSIHPYLLWIFSDSLRKFILQKFGFIKTTTKITSITTVQNVAVVL